MPLSIKRTTDAASEPLSLQEAKDHLRVDDTASDTLITSLIKAARQTIEEWTSRQLLTATWVMALDCFPWQWGANARFGGPLLQVQGGPLMTNPVFSGFGNFFNVFDQQIIRIPRPPLQSIGSIAYIDTAGVQQTLNPSLYVVDDISEPGRISPAYGKVWPTTLTQINAVTITFVAGWTTETMPETVKHLTRLIVGDYYENRVPLGSTDLAAYSNAVRSLAGSLDWGDYK
jgi:hypothetical protein